MHEYSTQPSRRKAIHMAIAISAAFVAIAVNVAVADSIQSAIHISPFFASMFGPTSMGVIWAICYYLFDRHLWKVPLGAASTISRLPNLNGTWCGEIKPITRSNHPPKAAAVTIQQTWSQITVQFHTIESGHLYTSPSRMAMLSSIEQAEGGLNYEFVSRSYRWHSEEPQGSAMIRYEKGKLAGEYYAVGTSNE